MIPRDLKGNSFDLKQSEYFGITKLKSSKNYFKPNNDLIKNYWFKLDDIDKAVRSLQLAIELEPNNSEIIDHLGDIYYKIGRKEEAIYEWKRALIGNADDKLKKDIKSKLDKYAQ